MGVRERQSKLRPEALTKELAKRELTISQLEVYQSFALASWTDIQQGKLRGSQVDLKLKWPCGAAGQHVATA